MKIENKIIPEGINTSREHPLREFFLLTGGVTAIVVVLVLAFGLLAEYFAQYIPFSAEVAFTRSFSEEFSGKATADEDPAQQAKDSIEAYLQELADKIAGAQNLPPGMKITVHYLPDDTVNAFATLGGHVFFFRGLLEKMDSENTLAMVMAHEIAHIRYRHPIKTLGRGVVVGVALSLVSTSIGDEAFGNFLGSAGMLTSLSFSRAQEQQSDEFALDALHALYQHVNGADRLFKLFVSLEKSRVTPPAIFSSHPLSKDRVDHVHTYARTKDWSVTQEVQALPQEFTQWLQLSKGKQPDKVDAATDTGG